MKFTVRNLAAEERVYVVSEGMETLGQLRAALERDFGMPRRTVVLCCAGRRYTEDGYGDEYLLEEVVGRLTDGVVGGEHWERVVHLCWHGRKDYRDRRTGWQFLPSQLEEKVAMITERHGVCELEVLQSYWDRIRDGAGGEA